MAQAGLEPPVFEADSFFSVSFPLPQTPGHVPSPQITPQITLTGLEARVKEVMETNPKISRKDLAATLGISADTAKEYIEKLKKKNIVRRVGPDRGGYWEIL